ncbi:tetratricopeptide repeat protein [bacterium]|nr:tetratricopeptide repeat protein [bacterium]MBU1959240.1 tetratricopeptide repeat protein [bacterium]
MRTILLVLFFLTQSLFANPAENVYSWLDSEYKDFRTYPRLNKAYNLIKEGNESDARVLLEKTLEIDNNNEGAIDMLMELCLKAKDKVCINKYLDRTKDADLGYFYKNEAQNAQKNKAYKKAIIAAKKSLTYDLKKEEIYFINLIILDAYLKLKAYDKADAFIKKESLITYELLKWSKVSDNLGESAYAYRLASELPNKVEYLKWQMELLLKEKKYKEASKKMEILYHREPTDENKEQLLHLYDLTNQSENIVHMYEEKLNKKCDEYALNFLLNAKKSKKEQRGLLEKHYPFSCLTRKKRVQLSLQLLSYLEKTNPKKAKRIAKEILRDVEPVYRKSGSLKNQNRLLSLYKTSGQKKKMVQIYKNRLDNKCDEYALLFLLDHYRKNKEMQKKLLEKNYPYTCATKEKQVDLSLQLVNLLDNEELSKKKHILDHLNIENIKPNYYQDIAYVQASVGDYEKSITYALADLKMNPNNTEAIKNIGFSYFKLGKKDLAVHYLLNASKLNPNDVDLLKNIGYLCVDLKQNETALYYWNLYLEKRKDPEIQLEVASLYFKAKKYDQTKKALNSYANMTKEQDYKYFTLKAKLAYLDKNLPKALNNYDKALAIKEDKQLSYEYIHLLQKANKNKKALSLMQKFSDRYPDNLHYKKELAYMYEQQKNYPKAIEHFKDISKKEPEALSNHMALAYAYKKVGNEKKAVQTFKNAIDNAKNIDQENLKRIKNEITNGSKNFNVYVAQSLRLDSHDNGGYVSPINRATYNGFGDIRFTYQPRFLAKNISLFLDMAHGHDKIKESIQPSIGVRYKPIEDKDLFVSVQKMIEAGKSTRDDILVRASLGIASPPNKDSDIYQNLYVDAAYFTNENSAILYGNYEAGKVYKVNKNVNVSPYVTTGGTYSNDNVQKQNVTNLDVGFGVAMSIKPDDTKYETAQFENRLKLEARQQYAGNAKDKNTVRLQWEFFY